MIYGRAGLQEFSEDMVKNEEILELTRKVHVISDEQLSKEFPEIQPAIASIMTKSGMVSERVDFPKGEPENPLTNEEFKNRYDMLMEYAGVYTDASDSIFDTVYRESALVHDVMKYL